MTIVFADGNLDDVDSIDDDVDVVDDDVEDIADDNYSNEEEDEEIVDPKIILEERCKESMKCIPLLERLNRCQQRVEGRLSMSIPTTETCQEELFDLSECVDQCVMISNDQLTL